ARAMSRRGVEFSTLPVRHRVHAELLRLARTDAADRPHHNATIAPAPTHAEIASRISTHREAVSRELAELTRSGLVERRGGDLVLRDIGALARMVEEALEEPLDDDPGQIRPALAGMAAARLSEARAARAHCPPHRAGRRVPARRVRVPDQPGRARSPLSLSPHFPPRLHAGVSGGALRRRTELASADGSLRSLAALA